MKQLPTLDVMDPQETLTVSWDFTFTGATIVGAIVQADPCMGLPDVANQLVIGTPTVQSPVVAAQLSAGQSGTIYQLLCAAHDAAGNQYIVKQLLPVQVL